MGALCVCELHLNKVVKKKLSASLSLFPHLETSDCEGSGQAERKTWQFPSAFLEALQDFDSSGNLAAFG